MDRVAIQQVFLQLSVDNPQHEAILSNLGTGGFYPASIDDFSVLKQTMTKLSVL